MNADEGKAGLVSVGFRNGALSESVDFATMADADGIPDLGTMILDGERLLVQVRRLNPDALEYFERPAYIAIVDLATETLVDIDTAEHRRDPFIAPALLHPGRRDRSRRSVHQPGLMGLVWIRLLAPR